MKRLSIVLMNVMLLAGLSFAGQAPAASCCKQGAACCKDQACCKDKSCCHKGAACCTDQSCAKHGTKK